ncbi:hypothetical protein AG1IA_07825 [Rhizoctonia solani AG-1 IA]|uniref:Uncharacterized protein n=1 Tax=Thanatephorus cucumeris (strain AG1-IA) TaxID=983506 RepID=L8WJR5_THACA|nr:hypothetical protein AG1IA_07825 [Rhizoctonia solani AG-1 IA]
MLNERNQSISQQVISNSATDVGEQSWIAIPSGSSFSDHDQNVLPRRTVVTPSWNDRPSTGSMSRRLLQGTRFCSRNFVIYFTYKKKKHGQLDLYPSRPRAWIPIPSLVRSLPCTSLPHSLPLAHQLFWSKPLRPLVMAKILVVTSYFGGSRRAAKPTSPEPSCGRSLKWNPETYSCVPNGGGESCNNGDFWWDNKKCCLPHGGVPVPPSPPSGYQCPNKWYWNSDKGCCVPSVPDVPATPACPAKCSWKPESYYCAPDPAPAPPTPAPEPPKTGPDSCSKTEFWWETKKCCLPIGGPHSPPSPPGPTAHPIGTGALLVVAAFQSPSLMTTSRLRALSLALGSLKPLGANRSLLVLRRAPTANSGGQIANAVCLMVVLRARQSHRLARRAQAGGAGESHRNAASPVSRLYSSQLVDWVDSGASLRSAVSHRA